MQLNGVLVGGLEITVFHLGINNFLTLITVNNVVFLKNKIHIFSNKKKYKYIRE